MLNKNLIKTKFQKNIASYSENAFVQHKMAHELCAQIPVKKYNSILEIGSYTGTLTCKIIQQYDFESYLAVDIVDSFNFIQNLSPKIKFLKEDIEKAEFNQKFDLIVSNASLQWCEDFSGTIKKLKSLLNKNGVFAISIFGNQNLKEIKEVFNVGLNYPEIDEIRFLLPGALIYQNIETLEFKNSPDILRHLKLTGVNALTDKPLALSKIKENLKILDEKYQNKLTYNPIYIIDEAN